MTLFENRICALISEVNELYGLNVCLGNLGLGGWGNQLTDHGGTREAEFVCLVFKILSKNPSR